MREMTMEHPYDEIFLKNQIDLHRYVFHKFLDDKNHDFYSIVDTYFRESPLRAKIDTGNLIALNTGGKAPLISINIYKCKKKDSDYIAPDLGVAYWMANIYCTVQWMYNLSSKEISENLPAKELANIYDKYYNNSIKSTCKNIYKEYLSHLTPLSKMNKEEDMDRI